MVVVEQERRRQQRVRLAVPVLCGTVEGHARGRSLPHAGWTKNVSADGVLALLQHEAGFTRGQIVAVDVEIPWDARRAFPFSRIAGTARVVRVEEEAVSPTNPVWGVALAFCPDVTRLGAMSRP